VANLVGVERSEAEAIYDSGREACVEFLMRFEERLRALEVKASRSSRNSSQPPSTDAPRTRQQRRQQAREKARELAREEAARRKAGGQDGHPGVGRKLLPEERMAEIVNHYPDECDGCGREFTDGEKVPRHGPGRHQVAELPPTAVVYIEHRTHRLRCPGCAERTRARLGRIGESAFGPSLQAAVVALTARNRISRRDMSELLGELFGVRISVGAIDAICQRTAAVLASPHERLISQVLACGAINVDETGWFLAGENRTMWTAASADGAVFKIVCDRHRDRLEELLGPAFQGIVTSDRWWAYDVLDPEQRQACWSHLQHDFRFHSEGLAAQKIFGDAGLALTRRLFAAWHAFAEHHDRDRLATEMTPIQDELREPRARRQQEQTPPSSPAVREQPAEALASTLDVHRHTRRIAHQQRCRASAPWTRDPPQAVARQPIRRRRTVHRTVPLRIRHLPPTTPIATRLPPPTPHRQPNRRRAPRPPLNPSPQPAGLNAYNKHLICRYFIEAGYGNRNYRRNI
jgi:hypothetical protein